MRALSTHYVDEAFSEAPGRADLVKEIGGPEALEAFIANNREGMYQQFFAQSVARVCNSGRTGKVIAGMRHHLVSITGRERLVTSDRPLLRAYGLEQPEGLLILPLAPRLLWVATNGPSADEVLGAISGGGPRAPAINRLVLRQAYKYAYGVCENHLPDVELHFGKGPEGPWRIHAGVLPGEAV